MAYLFGGSATDIIASGATIARGATFSLFVRVKPTNNSSATRVLVRVGEGSNINAQIFMDASNNLNANFFGISVATWAGPLSAGTRYSIVYTYDGGTANLYVDTDATPKATVVQVVSPPTPSQCYIGNAEPSNVLSADARIYECGWWPGTVLTGAQAAKIGAANSVGLPLPTNYWGLVTDAKALFGTLNGTATAGLVAHEGVNLYGGSNSALTLLGVG